MELDEILKLIKDHEPKIQTELARLEKLKCYIDGAHPRPYLPDDPSKQYTILTERATTNLLPMVRNASLQQLFVKGIRTSEPSKDAQVWDIMQANQFDLRQTQIFSSALDYGAAFGVVQRGEVNGQLKPVIRGISARRMYVLYEDPVMDEWPTYAFMLDYHGLVVELWDDRNIYKIKYASPPEGQKPAPYIDSISEHGSDVCPVVRFASNQDLDGRCIGEIEPLLTTQDKINQISFDLLIVQHYNAFTIQGISGVSVAKDKVTGKEVPIQIKPDRLITLTDPDSKAWQLPGSPLDGYIKAFESAVNQMAIQSGTPAQYMMAGSNMSNLSADALAAAEKPLTRKVQAYKVAFGESVEKLVRQASVVAGYGDLPERLEVVWEDRESRSLAQVADALNKFLTLGIPAQGLWDQIPGVTQSQIEEWKKLVKENDPNQLLLEQMQGVNSATSTRNPVPERAAGYPA